MRRHKRDEGPAEVTIITVGCSGFDRVAPYVVASAARVSGGAPVASPDQAGVELKF